MKGFKSNEQLPRFLEGDLWEKQLHLIDSERTLFQFMLRVLHSVDDEEITIRHGYDICKSMVVNVRAELGDQEFIREQLQNLLVCVILVEHCDM